MKTFYLFFLGIIVFFQSYSQTRCEDAYSSVIYAYSHVKSAYTSNNIDHLKYYSERSLESFREAKTKLESCGCRTAYNHSYDASELLKKVAGTETFEDGRFFVKQARELARATINELELCTEENKIETDVEVSSIDDNEDEALAELEEQHLILKQQQLALKRKEEQLKKDLAQKEAKELKLKKERLIKQNQLNLVENINTFNSVLSAYNCNSQISRIDQDEELLLTKSLDEIKSHFLGALRELTSNYLEKLNSCSK